MRNALLCIVLVSLLFIAGCWESLVLVGSGAAGGLTAAKIVQQQKDLAQANIDLMEQQLADQDTAIAAETDEAKKIELQKERDNTSQVLDDLKASKIAWESIEAGMGTDWGKPTAVITFISTLAMLILEERQRRKKNDAEADAQVNRTAVVELVAGGEGFKKAANKEAVETFKIAQGAAQKSQVTRELVAVIKA